MILIHLLCGLPHLFVRKPKMSIGLNWRCFSFTAPKAILTYFLVIFLSESISWESTQETGPEGEK